MKGKFAVAPLPGLDGPGKSTLGGHNLAISTYSKHKKSALDFIKFYTSHENQKKNLELASQAPTFADIYDDAALQKKYPYLTTLRDSINGATVRPKVVALRRRHQGHPGRGVRSADRQDGLAGRGQAAAVAARVDHQGPVIRLQPDVRVDEVTVPVLHQEGRPVAHRTTKEGSWQLRHPPPGGSEGPQEGQGVEVS